jgi:hypothetical protein
MTTASFEFKMTADGRFTDVKEVRMTKLEQVARAISDRLLARHVVMLDDQAIDAARAAVEALRDVSFSILGAEPLEWNDVIDLILNEKTE